MTTAQTVSVSINRPADNVYAYMRDFNNLPSWAAGLGSSIVKTIDNNTLVINTPKGEATVRFAEKNKFRIMDHYVKWANDPEVYNPIRVLENGKGSEVIFTLFRQPDMDDEQYAKDRQAVEKDLATLKQLLERSSR